MILVSLLPFIPPFMIGFLTVCLLWPGLAARNILLKLFLALGTGVGITSILYFFWCLAFDPRSPAYWIFEFAVLSSATVLFYRSGKWRSFFPTADQFNISRIALVLSLVLAAALYYAIDCFYSLSFMLPHGIQDAWGIWNMRARFMFRGGESWLTVFSPLMYWLHHTDYPFLVTASVARAWSLLGSETFRVPLVLAGLFTFSTAGLLFSALMITRSFGQGIIAAVVLLSTPWFLTFGSWQISDVPLSYFMLSVFVLIYLDFQDPSTGRQVLTGLMAGLAAWTKNEGLPFLLIGSLLMLAALWFHHPSTLRRLMRSTLPYLGGLLLPGAAITALKFSLAPPNDLFAAQTLPGLLASLFSPSRFQLTLEYIWRTILGFGQWPVPILFGLAVYLLLLLRSDWQPSGKTALLGITLATLSMAAVYLLIYLITPHDLEWHLKTSTNRLAYHFFPTILWMVFLAARTPEELVNQLSQICPAKNNDRSPTS